MKLGLVTYMVGAQWDLDTLIANCRLTGFEGVELRTTHAHGVEDNLSKAERRAVRKKFEDAGVRAYALGTAYEFHSPDPAGLKANIEGAKRYLQLAADVGAEGVKVRPNGLPDGVSERRTLEQIGAALRQVAEAGSDLGVAVWLEVHGRDTQRPDRIRTIMQAADHPNAGATWNCNGGEIDADGSIRANFDLLKDWIACVHIHELWEPDYPWGELFELLCGMGFDGWTGWEGHGGDDPIVAMKCYRRLWELYQANVRSRPR